MRRLGCHVLIGFILARGRLVWRRRNEEPCSSINDVGVPWGARLSGPPGCPLLQFVLLGSIHVVLLGCFLLHSLSLTNPMSKV